MSTLWELLDPCSQFGASGLRQVRTFVVTRCSILTHVDDRDRARSTASDWWLYGSMSVGERDERVELERGESSRAREAWRGYERV